MHLQGKTIGYFVAQEVEDLEFWVPVMRLREEGARVIVIGLDTKTVHGKHGLEMTPDVSIDDAPGAVDEAGKLWALGRNADARDHEPTLCGDPVGIASPKRLREGRTS